MKTKKIKEWKECERKDPLFCGHSIVMYGMVICTRINGLPRCPYVSDDGGHNGTPTAKVIDTLQKGLLDMNRTVALIKVTRRGVAILLAIAVLVALAGLTRAENVTIEAKYWPDTAELRLRLFGESKYCDLNTTCEVEFDVDPDDIDFECDDGCGGGGVWNTTLLYTAIIDSRNDVMNAVARNASTCSVDGMERLGLIPTTDQQKALMDESRTSLYEFITRDVMPDVAEFNKLKADLESAELRLVESQKENEVQRVTFLNATDADKILIQELRDDKARINGRYDGAQLIILALVLYSSGALAFVLDKLRGAT